MGRYYKVALGFLTLGFEMNLLIMTSPLLATELPSSIEAMFVCGFIGYASAFLMAGFLNFGNLKGNPILPFAAAAPAILAGMYTLCW